MKSSLLVMLASVAMLGVMATITAIQVQEADATSSRNDRCRQQIDSQKAAGGSQERQDRLDEERGENCGRGSP